MGKLDNNKLEENVNKIKKYDTFLLFIKNTPKEFMEFKYYLYNGKFINCEVGVGNNKNKEALNIFKYIRETLNIDSNLKNVNLIINGSLTNIINSKNFDKIVNQKNMILIYFTYIIKIKIKIED